MRLATFFLFPFFLLGALGVASEWRPALVLENGYSGDPHIALAPDGTVFGVWTYYDPNWEQYGIQAGIQTPDRKWTKSMVAVSSKHLSSPAVATDNKGNSILVWLSGEMGQQTIHWATFDKKSSAWKVEKDTLGSAYLIEYLAIQFDDKGTALLAWVNWPNDTDPGSLSSACLSQGSKGWTFNSPLVKEDWWNDFQFAFDPSGNALALWGMIDIHAARLAKDSVTWESTGLVSPSSEKHSYILPKLAVDREGNGVALFVETGTSFFKSSYLPTGEKEWKHMKFSPGPKEIHIWKWNWDLAINTDGTAYSLWFPENSIDYVYCSKLQTGGDTWTISQVFSNPAYPYSTTIAKLNFDRDGNGLAILGTEYEFRLWASTWTNQEWSSPELITSLDAEYHNEIDVKLSNIQSAFLLFTLDKRIWGQSGYHLFQ